MLVKCKMCGIKNMDRNEMKVIETKSAKGNIIRKYYHDECLNEYLKAQKQKEIDKRELEMLDKIIKETFGVALLPNQAYIRLASIRNGVRNVRDNNSQREGYTYSEIADSFIRCEGDIAYYLDIKQFDTFLQAFNYVCEIIISDLNQFTMDKKAEEQRSLLAENIMGINDDDYFEYMKEKKHRPRKNNVSSVGKFFDDDL